MIVINYPAAEVILREGGLSFSQVKKKLSRWEIL